MLMSMMAEQLHFISLFVPIHECRVVLVFTFAGLVDFSIGVVLLALWQVGAVPCALRRCNWAACGGVLLFAVLPGCPVLGAQRFDNEMRCNGWCLLQRLGNGHTNF